MFIDRDPNAGLVKTWACESSLKVLKVMVTGIPRPDLEGVEVVGEVYAGEGPTIQSQVYDRLARLTNMESLWLGHSRPNSSNSKKLWDCLEMSLESGLDKLSGLKGLKELSVSHMSTKIGLKELQWMIEHWPRLRAIYGLNGHYFFVRENEAHGNVIPHLWRDINFKWDQEENTQAKQKKAFRRVVLEDYLLEQQ
ncbi:hypothetical protein BGZ65_004604 [Modicella reniformis]|uniref:Uncharacterized protein n=1 Tax=Modicella reniformis TaxID=1440133 RepID=A0A9P6IYD8_9FUNG|nr:hypothetical protein BGZ65_004604 [Modicella reniformis]